MPRHPVGKAVGGEQWRNQKEERPRREQGGLDQFPTENDLRRHRQRQQKSGLAIAEQVRVADDQVAEQQEHKEKREQQEQQPFHQQGTQTREMRDDELQTDAKQPEGQRHVADDEKADQGGEQARAFANALDPPPRLQGVDAKQQREWRRRARLRRQRTPQD